MNHYFLLASGIFCVTLAAHSADAQDAQPAGVKVQPGGLRLSLSLALREPPAARQAPAIAAVTSYTPANAPYTARTAENPYMPRPPRPETRELPFPPIQVVPDLSRASLASLFSGFSIPLLPESGQSILPRVTKVYPTGEKPLVVVSFKCPTELVGITPPTIKLLHEAVNLGMEGLNKTDLLSFNLQQVCQ